MPGDIPCWLVCVQKLRIFWQTDYWYPWILIHSWEKSQCKKYLSHYFLVDCWLIRIDVSDNFVNLSEHFQANVWRFKLWEKDTKGVLLLLLCSGKCPHNRPSGHGYLLATDCKNHPIERLWISKQRLKAKCQNLITMDNRKSLMQRFMSDHRELFSLVCRITTHHFFCLYCYLFVALLCLYFFM